MNKRMQRRQTEHTVELVAHYAAERYENELYLLFTAAFEWKHNSYDSMPAAKIAEALGTYKRGCKALDDRDKMNFDFIPVEVADFVQNLKREHERHVLYTTAPTRSYPPVYINHGSRVIA